MGLTAAEKRQLEMEVVPRETRLQLTRIIRDVCSSDESPIRLVRTARFVNMANHVMNRQPYVLETDDWGEDYPHAAYALIDSERELIMRRPSTVELADILGDYLQAHMLAVGAVNTILAEGNCGFSFTKRDVDPDRVSVSLDVVSIAEIPDADLSRDHPNVRLLVARMDRALGDRDYAAVLHSSASIFETLAKDVVENPECKTRRWRLSSMRTEETPSSLGRCWITYSRRTGREIRRRSQGTVP
jgi:hypothetical protein